MPQVTAISQDDGWVTIQYNHFRGTFFGWAVTTLHVKDPACVSLRVDGPAWSAFIGVEVLRTPRDEPPCHKTSPPPRARTQLAPETIAPRPQATQTRGWTGPRARHGGPRWRVACRLRDGMPIGRAARR